MLRLKLKWNSEIGGGSYVYSIMYLVKSLCCCWDDRGGKKGSTTDPFVLSHFVFPYDNCICTEVQPLAWAFVFFPTGWPFSNTVCKMSGFVQGVSVSASVFTLVAIAVERWVFVVV